MMMYISVVNSMSKEDLNKMTSGLSEEEQLELMKQMPFLRDAEGIDEINTDTPINVNVETHKGLKATKIENSKNKKQ